MATKPRDPYQPQERTDQRDPSLSLGFRTLKAFQIFGLRILVQSEARCPLCDGYGKWTPPHLEHTSEVAPCPCTRAPKEYGLELATQAERYQGPLERTDDTPGACEQCGGRGMWRPPYQLERVPCDLCTSAPISTASATTSDADGLAPNKA